MERQRVGLVAGLGELNDWARGPVRPSHTINDLDHFTTCIKRRAIAVAFVGFVLVISLASVISYLIWGTVYRFLVMPATLYWLPAWQLYMRHQ